MLYVFFIDLKASIAVPLIGDGLCTHFDGVLTPIFMEIQWSIEVEFVITDAGNSVVIVHLHGVIANASIYELVIIDGEPEFQLVTSVDMATPTIIQLLLELQWSTISWEWGGPPCQVVIMNEVLGEHWIAEPLETGPVISLDGIWCVHSQLIIIRYFTNTT
jgi:hypothetical protein